MKPDRVHPLKFRKIGGGLNAGECILLFGSTNSKEWRGHAPCTLRVDGYAGERLDDGRVQTDVRLIEGDFSPREILMRGKWQTVRLIYAVDFNDFDFGEQLPPSFEEVHAAHQASS